MVVLPTCLAPVTRTTPKNPDKVRIIFSACLCIYIATDLISNIELVANIGNQLLISNLLCIKEHYIVPKVRLNIARDKANARKIM